jgi:FAD/FMN-containing dehydrogenase
MNSEKEGKEAMITESSHNWRARRNSVDTLAEHLHGSLVQPGDPLYMEARAVHNAAIDRYPALIVRCADASDVAAAIAYARAHDLEIAVRSGGHSLAGFGTTEGGLVIDLSPMKAIAVDPLHRTARLEPGLTWAEVAAATQPYGLALTSGNMGSVGVGGLLLGGGIGFMVRKYGLTIDRLRAVELVTADGRLLRASADEHADLFWGLRGGGGNFGVATAFEVDLHPAGTVLGGIVLYDAAEAKRLVPAFVHLAAAAPDELTTQGLLMCAPPLPFIPPELQGKPVFAIFVCYTGDLAEGERMVAPLRALGTPIADLIAPMPYPALFALTGGVATRGMAHDDHSLLLKTLDDAALQTFVRETLFYLAPGMMAIVAVLGGAMSRVAPDATAFAHRDAQAVLMISYTGPRSESNASLRASMEQIWQAIRPYGSGAYVNFVADEGEERVHEAYPAATYARLAALKRQYDPTNLFHLNQNIKPAIREG